MMNMVILEGRMVRDAELHHTQSNQAVARFSLAVNRNYKNQNGEREADFINCVIWRQQAENLANWAKKGTLISVEGMLQNRSYENKNGERVYVTEVIVRQFHVLESRGATQQRQNNIEDFSSEQQLDDNSPFGNTQSLDISNEELPF